MGILSGLIDFVASPFRWISAGIHHDRFRCYPGQCHIFIGLPGSGKTLGAACMISRSKQFYKRQIATEDAGLKGAQLLYPETWESYKIRNTLMLVDESALNGFFSRDAGSNFSQRQGKRNKLTALKLRRHLHNGLIITTQSLGDNDSVIRSMTSAVWLCSRVGKGLHLAQKCAIWYDFDSAGNYNIHVEKNSIFYMITHPYSFKIYSVKRYKKYYNSFTIPSQYDALPDLPEDSKNTQ